MSSLCRTLNPAVGSTACVLISLKGNAKDAEKNKPSRHFPLSLPHTNTSKYAKRDLPLEQQRICEIVDLSSDFSPWILVESIGKSTKPQNTGDLNQQTRRWSAQCRADGYQHRCLIESATDNLWLLQACWCHRKCVSHENVHNSANNARITGRKSCIDAQIQFAFGQPASL